MKVESRVVPLLYADIDTDQIIPARHLTSRTTEEFARALFANHRAAEESFVLNRPGMAGRSVLLAGRNFGCGSSREQAVWALKAGGFRAVIAPGFGEIFESNALKNGLLPVRPEGDGHAELVRAVEADPGLEVVVDLVAGTVTAPGTPVRDTFTVDPFYRGLIIEGIGELDYLLRMAPEIRRYEAQSEAMSERSERIDQHSVLATPPPTKEGS